MGKKGNTVYVKSPKTAVEHGQTPYAGEGWSGRL